MRTRRIIIVMLLFTIAIVTALGAAQPARANERVTCSTPSPQRMTCRIDEPNVTRPISTYPQITFRSRDRVTVCKPAAACKQAGGVIHGNGTWIHPVETLIGCIMGLFKFPVYTPRRYVLWALSIIRFPCRRRYQAPLSFVSATRTILMSTQITVIINTMMAPKTSVVALGTLGSR